jgi:hypothetical protein
MRLTLVFVGSLLAPSIARADDPRFHFSVQFDKAVIGPGESVTCSVYASYEPVAGTTIPFVYNGKVHDGIVLGYGFSLFDFFATPTQGTVGLFTDMKLNNGFIQDKGFGDPMPNAVLGVGPAASLDPGLPTSPDNPIFLWSAVWTPSSYQSDQVMFATDVKGVFARLQVPEWGGTIYSDKWAWSAQGASVTIVPAPAVDLVVALVTGGLLARRRPR